MCEGQTKSFQVLVVPLTNSHAGGTYFLVLFKESQRKGPATDEASKDESADLREILAQNQNLERELSETRDHLQSVIEDLEATNEELKSSNEEILSSNEELQSTNEELQTAKEEVQSANEELNTLNEELYNRNQDLAQSNDDFNNLLSSARIPFVMLESDLRIRRFTEPAKKLLRLIPSDVGRPIGDIRHRFQGPNLEKLALKAMDSMEAQIEEVCDESEHWYSMEIRPYRTSENKIDGVVIIFVDIDRLKKALQHEQRFTAVVRDSSDAITLQDFEGNILAWNHGAERIYGYSEAEALASNISRIVPPNKEAEALEFIERLRRGQKVSGFETVRIHKDGHPVQIWLNATLIRDQNGKAYAVATTESDISERKKAERAERSRKVAEQANVAKTEFLSNMSHEIRTPLSVILGYAESLERASEEGSKERTRLERIRESAIHLNNILKDILDLSKIEEGQVDIKPERFLLSEKLAPHFEEFEKQAKSKGLDFRVDYESDLPEYLNTDITRLSQILTNVIGNAVKFTSKGSVSVAIRPNGALVEFVIKDTGRGIKPKDRKKIFERFSQADSSITRTSGGTGLGLPISRALARALGGDVKLLESDPKGVSCFVVSIAAEFPVASVSDAPHL